MQIVLKVSHHHRQPRLVRLAQYVKPGSESLHGPDHAIRNRHFRS